MKVKMKDGTVVTLIDAVARLVDENKMTDNDGAFFQRQLEAIETQTYDVLYPDLEARECFATNTFGGAGAQTLTYRSYDRVGKAQVINARAIDLPKSDIMGKEFSLSVKSVGVAYDFDVDEIAAANMAGLPLEARRAMASRRGYEEFMNDAVWYGNAEAGFTGFFEQPSTTKATVAVGTSTNTEWSTKTPEEIIGDLVNAVGAMFSSTKKIHRPEELWLPVALWNYIRSTPRSINSDTTILAYFLQNNEFITDSSKVKALNAIEGQGNGGSECFVVIAKTTPEGTETVRIREPLPLQYFPVQQHGLVYEVPGRGRMGALEVTYPAAIAVWSGI